LDRQLWQDGILFNRFTVDRLDTLGAFWKFHPNRSIFGGFSMDDSEGAKKTNNDLSGSGARVPRTQKTCRSKGDLDMDTEDYSIIVNTDAIRRTLSTELNSSLVIGEGNWKTMNTVHRGKQDFSDSDSLMDDSFAGSSFASGADSICEGDTNKASSQFTEMDDGSASGPSSRRATPRRSYSKQKKQIPKKSDALSAISETDNDDGGSVDS
jgi:hypothetical protein